LIKQKNAEDVGDYVEALECNDSVHEINSQYGIDNPAAGMVRRDLVEDTLRSGRITTIEFADDVLT